MGIDTLLGEVQNLIVQLTAIANVQGMVGLQFHPEVTHTPQGTEVIRNFLYRICGCEPTWTTGSVICLLYTSPSPRDLSTSRMPSCA